MIHDLLIFLQNVWTEVYYEHWYYTVIVVVLYLICMTVVSNLIHKECPYCHSKYIKYFSYRWICANCQKEFPYADFNIFN